MTTVQTNDGLDIAYTDTKNGERPVLFVPPFGATRDVWRSQIETLGSLGYRVIAYDVRGHGESQGNAKERDYSIELFSEDLETLVDNLCIEKISIVGASMGGMIALQYAAAHPEMVDNLVLVGSYAGSLIHHEDSFKADHAFIREHGIEALRKAKQKDAAYFGKGYDDMSGEEKTAADVYFSQIAKMDVEEYVAVDLAIVRKPDQTQLLKKLEGIHGTVRFISGGNDFFNDAQREMSEQTPRSDWRSIYQSGHLCWLNKPVGYPNRFDIELIHFLAQPSELKFAVSKNYSTEHDKVEYDVFNKYYPDDNLSSYDSLTALANGIVELYFATPQARRRASKPQLVIEPNTLPQEPGFHLYPIPGGKFKGECHLPLEHDEMRELLRLLHTRLNK